MTARDVFITGATGFIGGRLAAALAARGDRLRCLVRTPSAAGELERLGARLVEGDITDDIALERGLTGVDLAYHLAGLYDIGVVDEGAMERVNVDGTQAFLRVAEAAAVPLAIHVSTTVALGPVGEGTGDELPPRGPFHSLYQRTKTRAHELALSAQRRGMPLIIVCPANVYGPGDHGPNGAFMRSVLRRRMPGLLAETGWYSYVHVDDVVAGLIAVADRGRIGSTYILSGDNLSVDEFTARVAALGGVRPPRLRFPVPLARATGTVMDAIRRRTGLRFPLSRELVDMTAGKRWLHGHDLATRELGWQPRPLAEGLPETVAWLRQDARA